MSFMFLFSPADSTGLGLSLKTHCENKRIGKRSYIGINLAREKSHGISFTGQVKGFWQEGGTAEDSGKKDP
jgi:hypothetical protein